MTIKEQLLKEIEQASESALKRALELLRTISESGLKSDGDNSSRDNSQRPIWDVIEEHAESISEEELADEKPIWEDFIECAESMPEEIAAQIPTDASVNLDHYLYGVPKKDQVP